MGLLYELRTSWSMMGFLTHGQTKARFIHDGKLLLCNDRLHRLQMTGMMFGASFFSNHVGKGSSRHDTGDAVASMD